MNVLGRKEDEEGDEEERRDGWRDKRDERKRASDGI